MDPAKAYIPNWQVAKAYANARAHNISSAKLRQIPFQAALFEKERELRI